MSLIFVLGNIGGALAAAVLPEAVIGVGGATAGAGTAAIGGTGAALGGAGAAGAAGTTTAGLFGGTSLAGLAGAPTGIAAGAGPAAGAAGTPGEAAATAALADKPATIANATSNIAQGATAATPATPVAPGAGTLTGSELGDMAALSTGSTGIQKGVEAKQQADITTAQNKGYEQLKGRQGQELSNVRQQQKLDESGLAGGKPLGAAHGGSINLQSGQFVIPADIVSDLGNGDTKAGMEFLKQFFETGGHA